MTVKPSELRVEVRSTGGKGVSRKLRVNGRTPAVLYGRGGESVLLSLEPSLFRKAMDPQRKLNSFFHLTVVDGASEKTEPAVIADVQVDPVSDAILHVDFLRVDPEVEVRVTVPVTYVGRSVGVAAGGKMKTTRREVVIAAKPADVPVNVEVDITPIDGGQQLRVRDLATPGYRILEKPETILVSVEAPKEKVEAAPAPAKGKKK